jgi:uroporphyrinogen-III synthase
MPRAGHSLPLQGWYVISLRPLGQHEALRRQAAKLGARGFALSTLRLQPLSAGERLREALRCPRVLFTSPAAVRFAQAQQRLQARAGQLWFAPGAGTAAALRRAGIERIEHPARGAGAESLLADPRLQSLHGARVGVVTAPGGRELLLQSLRERGARLSLAAVYERTRMRPAPARLRALAALPARSALLLSSGESLQSLWQSLDAEGRLRLGRRVCVASSERLAAQARALGFAALLRAEDARPASLLAALAAHAAVTHIR